MNKVISLPELFTDRTHSKNDVKVVANTVDEEGKHALRSVVNSLLLCILCQSIAHLYKKKNFNKTSTRFSTRIYSFIHSGYFYSALELWNEGNIVTFVLYYEKQSFYTINPDNGRRLIRFDVRLPGRPFRNLWTNTR